MSARATNTVAYERMDAARLEREIQRAKDCFMAARTPAQRRVWLRTMEALIARRSPEQVAKMERERGIG